LPNQTGTQLFGVTILVQPFLEWSFLAMSRLFLLQILDHFRAGFFCCRPLWDKFRIWFTGIYITFCTCIMQFLSSCALQAQSVSHSCLFACSSGCTYDVMKMFKYHTVW